MKKGIVLSLLAIGLMFVMTACGVQISSISLQENLELKQGDSETLSVEYLTDKEVESDALAEAAQKLELTWTSSDETVAAVDEGGTVTAVSPGEATISVSDKNGKLTANYCVTVIVPIIGIEVPETLTLGLGGTETTELGSFVIVQSSKVWLPTSVFLPQRHSFQCWVSSYFHASS